MTAKRDLEVLKDLGAGKPASAEVARLYEQAFREFGAQYLWSRRLTENPTFAQALTIADTLRREGDNRTRRLAAEIEAACHAAL